MTYKEMVRMKRIEVEWKKKRYENLAKILILTSIGLFLVCVLPIRSFDAAAGVTRPIGYFVLMIATCACAFAWCVCNYRVDALSESIERWKSEENSGAEVKAEAQIETETEVKKPEIGVETE